MGLQQQIETAWKDAVKARDTSKTTFTMIRTELKNKLINDKSTRDRTADLPDEEVVAVLQKMAKQRRESIAEYQKGGRDDLVEKETAELATIETFLPAMLSDEELAAVVEEVVQSTGASGPKEMGKVMGALMPKVKGKADGRKIQEMVKAKLGS
jgi:uncharacterized protein